MFLPFLFRLEMLCTHSTAEELRGTSLKIDGWVTRRVIKSNQKMKKQFFYYIFIKGLKDVTASGGVKRITFSGARLEVMYCQKLDHS